MPNINLLPEELRRREQKELEHLAKQRRVERIGLNRPLPMQQALKKESDKPKRSWLKEFFGIRQKPVALPLQTPPPVAKSSFNPDLLAASKKKQFNYRFGVKPPEFTKAAYAGASEQHPVRPQPQQPQPQWQPRPAAPRQQNGFFQPSPRSAMPPAPYKTYAKPKEKKSFWAWLFVKKPKAPRPMPIPKPAVLAAPVPSRPMPAFRPQLPAPAKPIKKEPRDSWWKIFRGLFTVSKKKNISGLHMAGEHTRVMTAPTPAYRPQNGSRPEIKPVQPSYHQAPPLPHPAVQVNFAKLPPVHHEPNFALLMLIFVAAWVFPVLIIYGGSTFINYQQAKLDTQLVQQQQEMSRLNNQLSPYLSKQTRLDTFNGRLAVLKSLLQNQNSWTAFFTLLEKYTLDDVYYRQLSASADGQLSLSAMAPDYQKAAEQTAVFSGAGDFVKEVKVNEAKEINDEKVGQVMINFQPRLYLLEGIFNKNRETVK
jgi:cell division protein FtsL